MFFITAIVRAIARSVAGYKGDAPGGEVVNGCSPMSCRREPTSTHLDEAFQNRLAAITFLSEFGMVLSPRGSNLSPRRQRHISTVSCEIWGILGKLPSCWINLSKNAPEVRNSNPEVRELDRDVV